MGYYRGYQVHTLVSFQRGGWAVRQLALRTPHSVLVCTPYLRQPCCHACQTPIAPAKNNNSSYRGRLIYLGPTATKPHSLLRPCHACQDPSQHRCCLFGLQSRLLSTMHSVPLGIFCIVRISCVHFSPKARVGCPCSRILCALPSTSGRTAQRPKTYLLHTEDLDCFSGTIRSASS